MTIIGRLCQIPSTMVFIIVCPSGESCTLVLDGEHEQEARILVGRDVYVTGKVGTSIQRGLPVFQVDQLGEKPRDAA
jgi:hypothetical protein